MGKYIPGSCVRPSEGVSGEDGKHIPKAMMQNVVIVSGQLARLYTKGILLRRMTRMTSVCVISDSTNQSVWNIATQEGSQQLTTQRITKKV